MAGDDRSHDHHDDGHGHRHSHGVLGGHDHSDALRSASRRSLAGALVLISAYMVAEVVGGILSGSLALLADAGHMLTDAAAIALALAAMYLAGKAYTSRRTYGYYRLEILAALANALALWLIAAGVVWEAVQRLSEPPEVHAPIVLAVGAAGLVVNVAAAWMLHGAAKHSLNVAGAFAHVMADLVASVGVLISGGLIWAFGWRIADPIVSIFIGAIILASTWRLLARVVHVLLEGVPEHVDIRELCTRMEALEAVTLVHDIHVWTISPGNDALSAHVLVDPDYPEPLDPLLRRLRKIASEEFGIHHITIQIERSAEDCTEHHHFDHLLTDAKPA